MTNKQLWKAKSICEGSIDKFLLALGAKTGGSPQKLIHAAGFSLPSREHIPLLASGLGLNGASAEIGVYEGYFSERILRDTKIKKLHSIDPWKEFGNTEYEDRANSAQQIHDERYTKVCQRLEPFKERSVILREMSVDAAKQFENGSLDFIYIDANHSYEGCLEDIKTWWPKLRKGGLIAGDDYIDTEIKGTKYGVKSAVTEFFTEVGEKFYVTYKPMKIHWPNWYALKQG